MSRPSTTTDRHGIEISGVTKIYPGLSRPAVDDVSLRVAPGEFMTFLGPSGSGKTTVLSLIAGFTALNAGSISIDGQDISRLKPHKRDLGVVFQQYALFPHLTVARNVAFPLEQRKVGKAEITRRVREILELVRLEAFADRLPRQLSGGQQQRVALARAVVYSPRALLMDEPLGALDKHLRDQLQREIARMHRELGMTFVFVTHDQGEALTLSDRIAVFNDGRVEQVGAPGELYDRPATLFVAQFLGESTIFRGKVDCPGAMVDCGAFALRAPGVARSLDRSAGVVVVRPERLELHPDPAAVPEGRNQVDAMVTDIVYVGNHHKIGLRFRDGNLGTAMRLVGSPLPVTPGESVTVSWDPREQSVVTDPDTPSSPIDETVETATA